MAWFRRETAAGVVPHGTTPDDAVRGGGFDDGDSPAELRTAIAAVVALVNSSAGRLPLRAVVTARRITDLLVEVVDTADVRALDVYAVISVKGAATDYLPTTLRSYLAVDESLVDVAGSSGRTPTGSLLEQLDALEGSAVAVLEAAQRQDVDALMTQGSFLRTKFSGSDLDL